MDEYEVVDAEPLPSRETAKIYCASFIQWMRTGIVASAKGPNKGALEKCVDGLERAFTDLITSYEAEITELRKHVTGM